MSSRRPHRAAPRPTPRRGPRAGRLRALAIAVALAVLVTLAGGAGATPLPVAIDRGDLHVRAAAGLEREARRVAERADRALARIVADLPDLPRPAVIEIRIVDDTDELTSVAPPGHGAPRWAAGVAYPAAGIVALAVQRRGQRHDLDKTLDHELAHLALGAAIPRAPRWLHEGFAWQHANEFDMARLETLAGMAWFGGVIPLEELELGFPEAEAPASRAYAESYDFVGYLAHRGRWADPDDDGDRWPFRTFLRELSLGRAIDDAARTAYGANLDELFDEWRADLSRRYLLVPASLFATGLWIVAALLLVLAWWRRRRRARAKLAQWEAAEAAADAARVHAPPSTSPWAAADPFAEPDPLDDEPPEPRDPPRWVN